MGKKSTVGYINVCMNLPFLSNNEIGYVTIMKIPWDFCYYFIVVGKV